MNRKTLPIGLLLVVALSVSIALAWHQSFVSQDIPLENADAARDILRV